MSTEQVRFLRVGAFSARRRLPGAGPFKATVGPATETAEQDLDFGEVKGQQHVKRAVEVAAAGGHNILTIGPIPPNVF